MSIVVSENITLVSRDDEYAYDSNGNKYPIRTGARFLHVNINYRKIGISQLEKVKSLDERIFDRIFNYGFQHGPAKMDEAIEIARRLGTTVEALRSKPKH